MIRFVAHALVRAASPLLATPFRARAGVEMSLDTARRSACATMCLFAAMTMLAYGQRGGQQQGRGGNQGQAQGQPQAAGGAAGGAAVANPGVVQGRVLSTTGEPLRKVSLTLRSSGRGGGNFA